MIDNRLRKTFAVKRAVGESSAVACLSINIFSGSVVVKCTVFMCTNGVADVRAATIADFDGISIENSM